MNEPRQTSQRYSVEVSGWDHEEDFFVEQTQLDWQDQNLKKVTLRHQVRTGSMVFLRLLQPLTPPSQLPVAYRVGRVVLSADRNSSEIHLAQLWPQYKEAGSRAEAPSAAPAGRASRVEMAGLDSLAPATLQIH